ncbi:MAG TPA: STAS/SEC14 domain-containing protein [Gammaproteobacteria bacterium]|nr:STAS/SEC14 domain-containing protein [Gammaproteobacteria bacterium]
MLTFLEGFPEGTIAVAAEGRVTAGDYDTTLIPKVEEALGKHKKIGLYYELGKQFSGIDAGAAWKDLKIGVEHLPRWERMALVTDTEWIRLAINAFRFLMPGKLRVFTVAEAREARDWISESQ